MKARERFSSGTSVLVGTLGDSLDFEVMVIDVSQDRTSVIITTSDYRQEGTPESALAFARQMRQHHGEAADAVAEAIERAANFCLRNAKTPRPILQ